MPGNLIVGIVAGFASALLFYSAARGGPLLRPVLLFVIPLPPLVAGLGWGWLSAAVAAFASGLVVSIIVGGSIALGYIMTLGIPSAVIAYLAYLSRPHPDDPNRREWYPTGRLIAAMAIYAGILPVMLLPFIGGSYEAMRPVMIEVLQQFSKRWMPPGETLTEQALAEQTDWALFLLPAGLAVQWLMVCAINLYLAARIVLASGRLARDWPDIASLSFPPTLGLGLALALVAANTSGIFAVAGTGFFGAFLAAYMLAGLALAHSIGRRGAVWVVWLVYLGLLFLWPFFMPGVVLAGLLESTFQLKRKLGWTTAST
jgi:hypothetical protein